LLSVVIPYLRTSETYFFLDLWLQYCDEVELIFVQDIDPSKTNHSLESYLKKFGNLNFKHISGQFNGPGGARNAGLDLATSEYISFWDIDDIPNVENFRKLLSKIIEEDAEIGVGGYQVRVIDSFNGAHSDRKLFNDLSKISIGLNPGLWRWIFKRSVIAKNRFPELRMAEDQVFLQTLRIFDHQISSYSDTIYTYCRGVPLQLTSSRRFYGDIPKAIQLILPNIMDGNSRSKFFRLILLFRLCGSVIKHKFV
jgi:glycosyltransferase involved in cell wall biosynthesis